MYYSKSQEYLNKLSQKQVEHAVGKHFFHSVTQGLACQNVPATGTVFGSPEGFAGYKLLEKSVKMKD